ncbi:MAG TPA: FIST N-terminal domain-containing protein [Candidatus Paceibacterota bacterium]
MKIEQKSWTKDVGWVDLSKEKISVPPQLVLMFAGRQLLEEGERFKEVRALYPDSHILTCSTAGEIIATQVRDNSVALTAVFFEKTTVKFTQASIESNKESLEVGKKLASDLLGQDLVHAMVFSDGQKVNGTQLVQGFNTVLPPDVSVTGGLVGDGADFKKTLVGLDESGREGNVVAIGFYGTALRVGYGSLGGWDPFGLERTITKSEDNVLYELDGKPALELYKEYLGEQAKDLPGSGLLFPLRLRIKNGGKEVEVVRTILGVDEAKQSMTFAGDMPTGAQATLMKANFERLIDGASGAGSMSIEPLGSSRAELAILISCIGRKLVLKERVEEEIEAVQAEIGEGVPMIGFYSYGELCPVASTEKQCELHNQTMTITSFREE